MDLAAGAVMAAIEAGRQITVYGDFDADGVSATAILVGAVRQAGGRCDWFIPDRIEDGYGLNPEAVRRLAARGTELLVTVDCGVTARREVALARELGLEVVVTDHHQGEPDQLPDCPLLHPELSGYPFTQLCGAAVAAKLASRLRRDAGLDPDLDEADLDLVALATVADVMPLVGENRRLVREGIAVARRARRPGMAALLAECRTTPGALEAEDLGFRLAPRINAAGRMYRADAGVELFLSDSPDRAAEIARELSAANAERRKVERQVLAEAESILGGRPEPGPAIVVAGEGWHPGVIGIVASRLVRAHGRPSVVIALDGDAGRGSARSVPGLNLHGALADCASELLGFGGHAAAAGLQIEPARIDSFRAALEAAVEARIGAEPIVPEVTFDAVAGGEDLGLALAEELARIGPFGNGNPSVRLLIPAAGIDDLREMGEGRHCRFTVASGGHRAAGVCFGRGSLGLEAGQRVDLIAELGLNHWNGSIEPRLVVRETSPLPEAEPLAGCEPGEWWERFEAAFGKASPNLPDEASGSGPRRPEIPWSGLPGVRIGELISSGSRVAVLTADAARRWRALGGAAGLERFNPGATVAGLWEGSPSDHLARTNEATVLLTDYLTLARLPADLEADFDDLVLLDPPDREADRERIARGPGRLHPIAGPDEFSFAEAAANHRFDLTAGLRELYRDLRAGGAIDSGPGLSGEALRVVLAGEAESPRSPERAALLAGTLDECGLLRNEGDGADRVLGVVSSVKVELTDSAIFRAGILRRKERIEFLRRSQKPV